MTDKPTTIEQYIENLVPERQELMTQVDQAISEVLPEATRGIKWSMPSYWGHHNIMHFSAHKNHFSLYPGVEAIIHFKERLKDYKTTKGAIQFPYNQQVDFDLIKDVTRWCHETGNHH